MARRQFLWIDPRGADCYFAAAGNIEYSSGKKGTLAIWQHTPPTDRYAGSDKFWRLVIDSENSMEQTYGRDWRVRSAGATKETAFTEAIWTLFGGHGYVWELMVYTWDFSAGAGNGVLRAYWDGVAAGTPITDATAPVGTATGLYLGPVKRDQYYEEKFCIGSVAVWDDLMTAGQVAELYAQTHRHRTTEGDGTGNLLLLATFDGCYDAEISGGSPTFTCANDERYCLLDDGVREQGRKRFLLGQPRHDLSEDDRVPLFAALALAGGSGQEAYVTGTNHENYSQLEVAAGYAQDRAVGLVLPGPPTHPGTIALWNSALTAPATYRQRIHVVNDTNPAQTFIRIGPVDYYHSPLKVGDLYSQYGSGRQFTVAEDAGNSVTQFKTNLAADYDSDYWNGAGVTFQTGNCAGRRLRATDYAKSTKILTLEGALPAIPVAGDIGVVDFRASIQGTLSGTNTVWGERIPDMSMDAWLWESYFGAQYFTELEWCYYGLWNTSSMDVINLLRYERGRTAYMDGSPGDSRGQAFVYGRPATWQNDSAFYCDILLERIEVDSPTTYQVLKRDASGHGPAYADNFMLSSELHGESTKVWRTRNVTRTKQKPTKISNPVATKADLQAANTWRHAVELWPVPVAYDEDTETVTVVVRGTSPTNVVSYGYCTGTWNVGTGRISWVDETPPGGCTNPFLTAADLRPEKASDAMYSDGNITGVFEGSDGWYLVYMSQQANVDHYLTYLLGPCADRWSFSRQEHWWDGNPLMSILGGPDQFTPEGNGAGQWVNRGGEFYIVENPYTKDPSRRYWGWSQGKTVNHKWRQYGADCRPLVGMRGADLRSMMPLPHGNQLTPLVGIQVHQNASYVYGQSDCLMQYSDTAVGASSGVYCFVSEDGVHWQEYMTHSEWLPMSELSGESNRLVPGRPFRLGDRTIYYYIGGVLNFAWCRVYGECWYALDSGETDGILETPLIEKPAEGWGSLVCSCDPNGGAVRVEVLDATEEAIANYARGDCDTLNNATEQAVTWDGASLADLTTDTIRLRFVFAGSGANLPKLYQWQIEDPLPPAPTVSGYAPTGTSVAAAANVVVTFSEVMDRATTEAAFSLSPNPGGGFSWSGGDTVLTFVPDGALELGTEYTATVGVGAQSTQGGALAAEFSWEFTAAPPDPETNPTDGDGEVTFYLTYPGTYQVICPDTGSVIGDVFTLELDENGNIVSPAGGILTITAISIPVPTSADNYVVWATERSLDGAATAAHEEVTVTVVDCSDSAMYTAADGVIRRLKGTSFHTDANGQWSFQIEKTAVASGGQITLKRVWTTGEGGAVKSWAKMDASKATAGGQIAWAAWEPKETT